MTQKETDEERARYDAREPVRPAWDSNARSLAAIPADEEGFFRFLVPQQEPFSGMVNVTLIEADALDNWESGLGDVEAAAPPTTLVQHNHTLFFAMEAAHSFTEREASFRYSGLYLDASSKRYSDPTRDFRTNDRKPPPSSVLGYTYGDRSPAFYFARRREYDYRVGGDVMAVMVGVGHPDLPEPDVWTVGTEARVAGLDSAHGGDLSGVGSDFFGAEPFLPGDTVLYAALYSEGDRVDNAQMLLGRLEVFDASAPRSFYEFEPIQLLMVEGAIVEIEFEPLETSNETGVGQMDVRSAVIGPLVVVASQDANYNSIDTEFFALTVEAGSPSNSVGIEFRPLGVDTSSASADITFSPMSVSATSGDPIGLDLVFRPIAVEAITSIPQHATVVLRLPSPTVVARQEENMADLGLSPPIVQAREHENTAILELPPIQARTSEKYGLQARIVLPAFAGVDVAQPDLVSTAVASDAAFPTSTTVVTDTAVAGDEIWGGVNVVHDVTDTAVASEWTDIVAEALLESVAVAEGGPLAFGSDALLVSTAYATDDMDMWSSTTGDLTDGALAGDDVLPYSFVDVEDSALTSDLLLISSDELVESVAVADDEVTLSSDQAAVLVVDGAWASDEYSHSSDVIAFVEDVVVADEVLVMKTSGLVAWVLNTDTGAASWYDNWSFTSMAQVGGKVFASGPEGLVLLGANTDGAELIDARVQYGFSEFGGYDRAGQPKTDEQRKRVQALWYGYRADGELQASVETYGQGYPTFTYAMPPRAADQPRNSRITPGKGLNARYWRVGVSNTQGCDFEVHSISAEVAQSNRRI